MLGTVKAERGSDGVKDAVGSAGEVPALDAGVVVDADSGEAGDFFAAEAGDAATAAELLDACLLGRDACTA